MEPISNTADFRLFRASWKKDNRLPVSWFEHIEPALPEFRVVMWVHSLHAGATLDNRMRLQEIQFKSLLAKMGNHNLKRYKLNISDTINEVNKATALAQLEELRSLNPGDCCLIYYFGPGGVSPDANAICEPVFSDADNQETTYTTVWQGLDVIPEDVHVFIIQDFIFSFNVNSPGFYKSRNKQLVVLENLPDPSSSFDASLPPDCFFQEQLRSIIEKKGAKMRYSTLINHLHLRYYQSGLQHKPVMKAFPSELLNTYIFSGVSKGRAEYMVSFNEERKQWELNAGLLNGVYPSLSFMHTLFELEDGRLVSINETTESYSTLMNFTDDDIENTYSAKLVQNALPKLKIGFDFALDALMKEKFNNAVKQHDIYFIDLLTTNNQDAAFLIKAQKNEYYLVRNSDHMGVADNRPVFFYQQHTFEFIKQLEYIAQWQALLELENSRVVIESDVNVIIEVMEGLPSDLILNKSFVKSRRINNPESIALYYRNRYRPRIRCQVELKNESTYEGSYFVQYLYLDSQFGIVRFTNADENLLNKSKPVPLKNEVKGKFYDYVSVVVEDFYLQNGVREIQDYLLVFISTEPVDLTPLEQVPLEFMPSRQIQRGAEIENVGPHRRDFVLPRGDWFLKRIPILVKYDDKSFEETVRELIKSRAIVNPNDQHKDRWGGLPDRNNFSLMAKVKKSAIPFMFTVTLTVKINGGGMADGGDVAFLLHNSFSNPVQFEKFVNNTAEISVNAYEDFTAAAILYDGTELELDLSYLPGLPDGFYAKLGSLAFNKQVDTLLARKANEIEFPEDLQKGRWGGVATQGRKHLSARVKQDGDTHEVTLVLEITGNKDFNGEVAFLLHDSFKEMIAYRKIIGNKATCVLQSYEAFTVGTYVSDGTELELDLNEQPGFPDSFYYAKHN